MKKDEDFAFLHVGQWTNFKYGEDRKDISRMIKVFYEAFANKNKQPALILKTNGATFSIFYEHGPTIFAVLPTQTLASTRAVGKPDHQH